MDLKKFSTKKERTTSVKSQTEREANPPDQTTPRQKEHSQKHSQPDKPVNYSIPGISAKTESINNSTTGEEMNSRIFKADELSKQHHHRRNRKSKKTKKKLKNFDNLLNYISITDQMNWKATLHSKPTLQPQILLTHSRILKISALKFSY